MIAAIVSGQAISVSEVDFREQALRATDRACALPRPDTSEGRQLRRWLTQVLAAEKVVAREAETLGVAAEGAPAEADLLPDLTARLEIGSIAAGVLTDPLGRAVYVRVTAGVDVDPDAVADYHRRNPHRIVADRDAALNEVAPRIHALLRGAACRRAFRLWLNQQCAETVRLAPGYEHPGDPRQPDNVHRH